MTNPQTTAIQADPLASDSASDTAPWTQAVALPDSVDLRAAHPLDLDAIEGLNATVFGPGRFARTAYRLRENTVPMQACCHICEVKGRLIASVVFSPIMIGNTPALLLGPLAVEHGWKNKGLGLALMQSGLQAAHAACAMAPPTGLRRRWSFWWGICPIMLVQALCLCRRARWQCPVLLILQGCWRAN
jgi:hypothetical protein